MAFPEAGRVWLEIMRPTLRESTYRGYAHNIKQLAKYFWAFTLEKIHIGHLRDYTNARLENRNTAWQRKAGPSLVNHEITVVRQILKEAKLWTPIGETFKQLSNPPSRKRKVLDEDEEKHLFEVAERSPEWQLACLVAKLARNTTACGSELRNLRLQDITFNSGKARIVIDSSTAKNQFRGRTIPLNETAQSAIAECIARAKTFGSYLPEHYLFPKRIKRNLWDPTQPASTSWLRTSFHALRKAAGFPWLTPHCFRHMAITTMLEKGAAPEVVRSIAGHVSEQMMKHYSHTRQVAQLSVLLEMDSAPPSPSKKKTAPIRPQQQRFISRARRRLVMRRPLV